MSVDRTLDLKGEVCPYTFVKTMLALDEMKSGQVLRVILDYLPAVSNVPNSLGQYGHHIISVSRVGPRDWHVIVRKK